MTTEPREEMLSAYLDNELSAEERARVEQWLDTDAEYRQLHEELRAVRADLQALPRHELADDLGPAVVRKAERAVLSGQERSAGGAAIEPSSRASGNWWNRSRRIFVWPAIAVAAALMVALFDTQRGPDEMDREVALEGLPEEAHRGADAKAAGEASEADVAVTDLGAAADEMPAKDARAAETDRYAVPTLTKSPDDRSLEREHKERRAGSERSALKRAEPAQQKVLRNRMYTSKNGMQDGRNQLGHKALMGVEAQPVDNIMLDSNISRALKNRDQVLLIQCDVTPEFISKNELDKVLAGNKLQYHRVDVKAVDNEPNAEIPEQNAEQQAGVQYTVDATPEQVELIVNELEQEQGRRRVSNLQLGFQLRDLATKPQAANAPPADAPTNTPAIAPAEPLADDARQSDQSLNFFYKLPEQPVTVYLRQAQPAPPAAAPVPAPAEPQAEPE